MELAKKKSNVSMRSKARGFYSMKTSNEHQSSSISSLFLLCFRSPFATDTKKNYQETKDPLFNKGFFQPAIGK
jgi:hypothetical protein